MAEFKQWIESMQWKHASIDDWETLAVMPDWLEEKDNVTDEEAAPWFEECKKVFKDFYSEVLKSVQSLSHVDTGTTWDNREHVRQRLLGFLTKLNELNYRCHRCFFILSKEEKRSNEGFYNLALDLKINYGDVKSIINAIDERKTFLHDYEKQIESVLTLLKHYQNFLRFIWQPFLHIAQLVWNNVPQNRSFDSIVGLFNPQQ